MDGKINAVEVLKIAEEMERDGARFYQKAAELFDERDVHELFTDLAGWELGHERFFRKMRGEIEEAKGGSSECDDDNYKSMAALSIFAMRPDPAQELSAGATKKDVLKEAVQNEKDSIVFYLGLKDFFADAEGVEKIDEVIKEEMRHITILSQSLESRAS